jgi:hypothetical protein
MSMFFVEYFLSCIGEAWLLHAVTKLAAFFRAASALLYIHIEYTNLHTYSYNTAIHYRLSYTNIGQCVHRDITLKMYTQMSSAADPDLRIRMFLSLLDPDLYSSFRGTDPDSSNIKQK